MKEIKPVSRTIVFSILGILLMLQDSSAQLIDSLLQNKRVYHTVNIGDSPLPEIDGLLDDEIWHLGEWHSDFTQQQPFGGTAGSEVTYLKVLYDRSSLFVAIICHDKEPEKIRNIFNRRDEYGGDMAGIAVDSYFDKRTAFEFDLTAAGQKLDVKHLGDYQWDFNWNAVWDGATSRNDSSWVAEMRIPFSQIRYANREEHVWGMHVWRWISRRFEEDQWQLIPLEAPAMVYLFGELKGLSGLRDYRQVEFLPYALGSLASQGDNGGFESPDFTAGIDAKVGISSDYTLDLTINPDFGQVEADPSVLNLTAFEVFFEERRPFFLEGTDVFDFEIDGDIPYYSRRIGSAPFFPDTWQDKEISEIPSSNTILGSAKFTGKSKKGLSVGVINGFTAREYGKVTNEYSLEKNIQVAPMSNYMASRIKREFRDGGTILGGVFSHVSRISQDSISRELLPSSAISGGLDFIHNWKNREYFFEAKTLASRLDGSPEAILRKQLAHNHRFQRPDADYLEPDSVRKCPMK